MMKAALLVSPVLGSELKWATFDGVAETTAPWAVKNDPVMGGGSTSDFTVTSGNTGLFQGFDNLALKVKSTTPDYKGFRIAFGAPGVPAAAGPAFGPPMDGSYKADFAVSGEDWQVIEVPLSQFSYDWSSFTGRCDTKDPAGPFGGEGPQHTCCSDSGIEPSTAEVCVESQYLSIINDVEIWAEGVEGKFNLEIEWVGVTKSDTPIQV